MGNCIRKKKGKKYKEDEKTQQRPPQGQQYTLQPRSQQRQQKQQRPNDTNETTTDVKDGPNERNDESLTVDLLREAFDEDKCNSFEQFLSKLNTIPKFCRIYSVNKVDKADGFEPTYFTKPIWYGGHPYYCPVGWRRYCLNLGMTQDEFDEEVGDWPIVYHGTDPSNVSLILKQGMRPSDYGCFLQKGERAVYLTPSIEYAGHPRYARIIKLRNGHYLQLCLQIRIHPSTVTQIRPGTLPGAFSRCEAMDPNFKDNSELEWLIQWDSKRNILRGDGLVIYGIMLRITKFHPYELSQNKWWKHALDEGYDIPYLNN